jgi:hypothetical protein
MSYVAARRVLEAERDIYLYLAELLGNVSAVHDQSTHKIFSSKHLLDHLEQASEAIAKFYQRSTATELQGKANGIKAAIPRFLSASLRHFKNAWDKLVQVESVMRIIEHGFSNNKDDAKEGVVARILALTGQAFSLSFQSGIDQMESQVKTLINDCQHDDCAFKVGPAEHQVIDVKDVFTKKLFQTAKVGALVQWAHSVEGTGMYEVIGRANRLDSGTGADWAAGLGSLATALAALFIGPMGWITAVGVLFGWIASWFSRESWQSKLAKKCVDVIQTQAMDAQYVNAITVFWRDTEAAFGGAFAAVVTANRVAIAELPAKFDLSKKPDLQAELTTDCKTLQAVESLNQLCESRFR